MKKVTKNTRTSAKQKFAEYKLKARTFINSILSPRLAPIFNIAAYTQDKKPNMASIPELLAIVGTAEKLGKRVLVRISGINELEFAYYDWPNFPEEL